MALLRKKYLIKPKTHTFRQIPPYFRNQQVAVMKTLDPYWMVYNISVVPNWVNYLREKIHAYKQDLNTTQNLYIKQRKEWKKYSKMADKA